MTNPPPGQWPPTPQPGEAQVPPPWSSPQPWGQQPQHPPTNANRTKWTLGVMALLVVVVVTVVATLLFTRDTSGSTTPTASEPPSTSVDASDIASADDNGPVGIITEDPTCAAWEPIAKTISERQQNGWDRRDPSVPNGDWSSEQRAAYSAVADAMRSAADQTTDLIKLTPHRVMRELYTQTAAYWRAYANRVPKYTPQDDHLAAVANSLSGTLVWVCSAITYGSAAAREPLVVKGAPPLDVARPGNPDTPERFLTSPSPVCAQWGSTVSNFNAASAEWTSSVDPNLSVSQWPPTQQALFADMVTLMQRNAGEVQQLGLLSRNPVWADFASLAAQYRRAYVQAIPTYSPADNYLNSVAAEVLVVVDQACKAVQG